MGTLNREKDLKGLREIYKVEGPSLVCYWQIKGFTQISRELLACSESSDNAYDCGNKRVNSPKIAGVMIVLDENASNIFVVNGTSIQASVGIQ